MIKPSISEKEFNRMLSVIETQAMVKAQYKDNEEIQKECNRMIEWAKYKLVNSYELLKNKEETK